MRIDPICEDPPADPDFPAAAEHLDLLPFGSPALSHILIAAGAGPHPTVLYLHGFPGYESGQDLAHAMRRAGWNVMLPRYRGAWGSPGHFTFTDMIADAVAALAFLRSAAARQTCRVNRSRLVVMGHSMGAFAALVTAAADAQIRSIATLASYNLGLVAGHVAGNPLAEAMAIEAFEGEDLRPLHGTSAGVLVREAVAQHAAWDFTRLAPRLADRRLLLIAARHDSVAPVPLHHVPFVRALKAAGAVELTETVLETNHVFSDKRVGLARTLVDWLAEDAEA